MLRGIGRRNLSFAFVENHRDGIGLFYVGRHDDIIRRRHNAER